MIECRLQISDQCKDLKSEKQSHIALIEQLNGTVTLLRGELNSLRSDKETGLINFNILLNSFIFITYRHIKKASTVKFLTFNKSWSKKFKWNHCDQK